MFKRQIAAHVTALLICAYICACTRTLTLPTAEIDWNPAHTRVFVVGTLEWKSDSLASFPKIGRRDSELVALFQQRGVPKNNITLIQDDAATATAVSAAFTAFLKSSEKNDTIFIYYCGHGWRNEDGNDVCFATYESTGEKDEGGWSVSSIFDAIEKHYLGTRVILLADCCSSGGFADAARERQSAIQYGALTSVLSSKESTGDWTFSDSFLDALRGAPQVDLNGDGIITFDETARYIRCEMSFFESQTASSGFSQTFKPEWGMAVVSGKKSHARIGEYVEVLGDEAPEPARIDDFKDGKFKVRFASPAERRAEWVTEKQIRAIAFMP